MAGNKPDLATARTWFADELRHVCNLRCANVIRAFATVPREAFVGAGPWQFFDPLSGYWETEDDDPRHLYHDVLVALDRGRGINNGQPSLWARIFDHLALKQGQTVVQVGAGAGYYTAILAEIVGSEGRIFAYEIEPSLAQSAARNLASWPNVTVIGETGASLAAGAADSIIVFAGATHCLAAWLDGLAEGGELVLPLTGAAGFGRVLFVRKRNRYFAPALGQHIAIYPCAGAREPELAKRLTARMWDASSARLTQIRRDEHAEAESCWLHRPGACLSLSTQAVS